MSATLVIPDALLGEIEEAAVGPLETAGVLLASIIETPRGKLRLLAHEIHWTPESAYIDRAADEMTISSLGYVEALQDAEERQLAAIWFHTHPGSEASARPSERDQIVDDELCEVFQVRTGKAFYASVVFAAPDSGLGFTGIVKRDDGIAFPIERIWSVGARWRLILAETSSSAIDESLFERNIRAFGDGVQKAIGCLSVGVVGAGGTGSAIMEQLVRLGVRDLTVFDPDDLSFSNITRVYGSTPHDVGQSKVEIARRHLNSIAPELVVDADNRSIVNRDAARKLCDCDVVFGCTDDNAGRLILSRLPSTLFTPVIDIGVLLSADQDLNVTGINGRVTVMAPGDACLVCRDRIDMARAAAETMSAQERERLQREGYAPALGAVEPAVIAFTTAVAAAGAAELLERMIGYGPEPRPNEILLRFHEREISTNLAAPRRGHYCEPKSRMWGRGGEEPFLGQLWTEE